MSRRDQKSAFGYFARRTEDPEADDCHTELLDMMIEAYARELAPTADARPSRRTCLQIFFRSRVGLMTAVCLAALGLASIAAARHAQSGPMPPKQSPPPYAAAASGHLYGHPKPVTPVSSGETAKRGGAIRVDRSQTTNRPPRSKLNSAVRITTTSRKTTITAGVPSVVEIDLPKAPLQINELTDDR